MCIAPSYLFFDDCCPMCNSWVKWMLKWDTSERFTMVLASSQFAKDWCESRGLSEDTLLNSLIVYIPSESWLDKGEAIKELSKKLEGLPWFLKTLVWCTPTLIIDWVYRIVSSSRRRTQNSCTSTYIDVQRFANRFIFE